MSKKTGISWTDATWNPVRGCSRVSKGCAPWHSVKQPVHHNNTDCNTGNNIEKENLRQGSGGKPLCQECARLSR